MLNNNSGIPHSKKPKKLKKVLKTLFWYQTPHPRFVRLPQKIIFYLVAAVFHPDFSTEK
jgi:hypothetical protein